MAFAANRVWIWRHRGTEGDRRTGFVEMTDVLARNEIVGGRAQDPLVGMLHLKHIDYTIPAPGRAAAAPAADRTPAPQATPKPTTAAPQTAPKVTRAKA